MSNRSFCSTLVLVAWCGLLAGVAATNVTHCSAAEPRPAENRAAWMPSGTFGVMTHYLITPQGETAAERTADLNRVVNRFDLDHFMRQFSHPFPETFIRILGPALAYFSHLENRKDRVKAILVEKRHAESQSALWRGEKWRRARNVVRLPGSGRTAARDDMLQQSKRGRDSSAEANKQQL